MRAIRLFALPLTLVALATLVLPSAAGAQTGLASITGIVSDASGAAVPGLTVTATNQATNIGYTGVTNEAGNYIITGGPIGTYVIATKLQGFKSVQSTVTLSAAQAARVCDHAVRFGVVESLNTTIKGVIRRGRGMKDETMLLLKLKWATARPLRSSKDLAKFLNLDLHANR